jgi:hypothetical protein
MQKLRAHPRVRLTIAASVGISLLSITALPAPQPAVSSTPPKQSTSLRLYVFDCGILHIADVGRFGLKPAEVTISDLAVPAFLIVHPKGTLIWDTGAVPDSVWRPNGKQFIYHVVLPRLAGARRDDDEITDTAIGRSRLFPC